MKTYFYKNLSDGDIEKLTKRPAVNFEKIFEIVKPVLSDIKFQGLSAAINYAQKFDGFSGAELKVTEEEFNQAEKHISDKVKESIRTAADNIRKFHEKQIPQSYSLETMEGINCSREFRAIESLGLYIPGGTAVLPSTMLMLAIPANIAGCKRICACSPSKDGRINYPLLYAAKVCGVKEFYKIGGAQAVGFMSYVLKTNKIFGPGNQYVTAAKMLVSIDPEGCTIDMPAGPSEVLVIADESANPSFAASDLLSQAEHGADSQVVLITTSEEIADKIMREVEVQLYELPRKEFAQQSLEKSFCLIVNSFDEAINFSNWYAPEHLILNFKNAEDYKLKILNAGSVFIGQYSPESVGDYASGTNHSLPTSGYAKAYGGVSVESFMKSITFQNLTYEGLKNISSTVQTLAEVEGLQGHKNAVSFRIKSSG